MKLQLDNSYIPKRTVVDPQSPYLKYRRFYCKKKAVINPLLLVSPVALYFLIRVVGN